MGSIKLSVGQINITGYLLVIVREVQNPGAEVARLVVPPPVPTSQNIVFNNMNDVVHYIDFRESTDGVSLGLLLSTFVYDVASGTAMAERRFYRAGGVGTYDPAVGATAITDPYLLNKTVYGVFKAGFRYLIPGVEYNQVGDTVNFLASPPDIPLPDIQNQEVVSLEINYTVQGGSNTATSNFPRGIVEIAGDITLGPTHINSLMEINGPGGVLTATFPDLLTIPDNSKFGFTTDNGSQRYLALKVPAGYYIQAGKKQRETIWLAQGEQVTLMKKGNYLRILSRNGDHNRVGEKIKMAQPGPLNGFPAQGGWRFKSDYPRVAEFLGELSSGEYEVTADDSAIPDIFKPRWHVGTTKFWVPDLRGYTDKTASGARRTGDVEGPQVGEFRLTGNFPRIQKSGTSNQIIAIGNINDVNLGNAPIDTLVNLGKEQRVLNAATFDYYIF